MVKHRLIFSWGKVNLLTGLHQEFIWLSLIVMLNGHPHSQVMLSKIITPSKYTSRLSYCRERNVTTSKGKGKFYNYQWMFLGHSPGKFLLHYFPPATNRPNQIGTCWGHFSSNTFHNYVHIKSTGITNFSCLKIHQGFSVILIPH